MTRICYLFCYAIWVFYATLLSGLRNNRKFKWKFQKLGLENFKFRKFREIHSGFFVKNFTSHFYHDSCGFMLQVESCTWKRLFCQSYITAIVSAVVDEPVRRAGSRQTCCKQRWTLSVIKLRPNSVDNACDGRRFRAIARKSPILTYPHLHMAPPLGVTPFEFCRNL